MQVVALFVCIYVLALADVNPLNAKVVAEGEAEVFPEPGNVIIICPLLGMLLEAVNLTVCVAVTDVKTAVPL